MMLIDRSVEVPPEKVITLAQWQVLFRDEDALLAAPGAHHKTLLRLAHSLHESQIIDRDDLSDLLEQADGALAYAFEALLDSHHGE